MFGDTIAHVAGGYRYMLTRDWDLDHDRMTIIMLNPSTADQNTDDPTIRRCITFAKREGHGGLQVVNLFGYRATNPATLRTATDPVGPDNDDALLDALDTANYVVVAWGAHPFAKERAAEVLAVIADHGLPVLCLGTTKDGHPRHPLYVKGDQPLVPYR